MEENNKLLAEFLGMGNSETTQVYFELGCTPDKLNFDKDWNRLMLVIDKIESLGCAVYIKTKGTLIENDKEELTAFSLVGENSFVGGLLISSPKTKIEATFNACIEFVKWYNK